jgi:L-lactate dehydrogenase complex protein LldG
MNGIKRTVKMGSRETILQTIKQNKPEAMPLLPLPSFSKLTDNPLQTFVDTLTSIGGFAVVHDIERLKAFLLEQKQKDVIIINGIQGMEDCNMSSFKDHKAADLETVDTVVLKGRIAVAENGAIWLSDKDIVNRSLPFICEHLIIVIDEASIVETMHQAYEKITIDEEGYGVFIAGPSKTADIEQSLVVGAHGPLSLQVYIV